jgi:HK97 family phage major capsid protein
MKTKSEIKAALAALLALSDSNGGVMTPEQSTEFNDLEALHAQLVENDARRARVAGMSESTGRKVPQVEIISTSEERDPMGGFKSLGEFASAVAEGSLQGGQVDERLRVSAGPTTTQKSFAEDGGFAVPAAMREEIWAEVYGNETSISSMVDQEPTNSNTVELAKDETTPWGTSGVIAYWGAEASQMEQSKLDLSGEIIRLHKVHALVPASSELLEDGPRLERRLQVKAPEAIRYVVDDAIVNGSGVGKPLGMLQSGSLVTVAKETSQTAATINATNVAKMFARLPATSISRAVWFVNQDTFPSLLTMTIGDQPVYLPPNALAGGPLGSLLGRPVFPIEQCATLGTLGDIMLVDPKGYYMPVKSGGIKFDQSAHLWFDYDVSAFKWTFRCGGKPHLSAAVTPAKGSATRSHIIALATRA